MEEISKNATADWNQVSLEKLAGSLTQTIFFLVNSDESAPSFQEAIWKNEHLLVKKITEVHTYHDKVVGYTTDLLRVPKLLKM